MLRQALYTNMSLIEVLTEINIHHSDWKVIQIMCGYPSVMIITVIYKEPKGF